MAEGEKVWIIWQVKRDRYVEEKDIRSYMINSDKIQNVLGFKFKKTVDNAIEDICMH